MPLEFSPCFDVTMLHEGHGHFDSIFGSTNSFLDISIGFRDLHVRIPYHQKVLHIYCSWNCIYLVIDDNTDVIS